MAKTQIPARADEMLLTDIKTVAEQNRWTLQTAIEMALEQFVNRYRVTQLLPEVAPEQPRVVVVNGITYTQTEAGF